MDCSLKELSCPRTWSIEVCNSQADPRPVGHDPSRPLVSKQFSLESRIHSARVRFSLMKFLCTKILVEGLKNLTIEEEFLLFDSKIYLDEFQDVSFWSGQRIREWKVLETMIGQVRMTSISLQEKIPRTAQLNFFSNVQKILPGPHAYYGWRKTFSPKFFLRRRNRALDRKAPPRRFVGVGYRDKGNAGNAALDGSPSWQEVASATNLVTSRERSSGLLPVKYWSELEKRERVFRR